MLAGMQVNEFHPVLPSFSRAHYGNTVLTGWWGLLSTLEPSLPRSVTFLLSSVHEAVKREKGTAITQESWRLYATRSLWTRGQVNNCFWAQAALYHPSHCIHLVEYCTVSDKIHLWKERCDCEGTIRILFFLIGIPIHSVINVTTSFLSLPNYMVVV